MTHEFPEWKTLKQIQDHMTHGIPAGEMAFIGIPTGGVGGDDEGTGGPKSALTQHIVHQELCRGGSIAFVDLEGLPDLNELIKKYTVKDS